MKTGILKVLPTSQERVSPQVCAQSAAVEACPRKLVQTRIELVEEDEAAARQKAGHEFAECDSIGRSRRVGLLKGSADLVSEGTIQRGDNRADDRLNGISEDDFANPMTSILGGRRHFVAGEAVPRAPRGLIDFGELVIRARKPEDVDRIDAATCYLFPAAAGGECLVESICRAREKPDL